MNWIDGKSYEFLTTAYTNMSAKQKERSNEFRHYTDKMCVLLSMFEYKIEGEDQYIRQNEYLKYFDPVFLELCLLCAGYCIIGEVDSYLLPMVGSRTGKLDYLGFGTHIEAVTQNGKQFRGELGEDCAIIYNNFLRMPEVDIPWFSYTFTEIDKSLEVALLTCRDTMLPIVTDDKMKSAIIEAVKAMRDGKPIAVTSKNLIDELLNGEAKTTALPLNHPENVKNIQYILKAYDDIDRRFWLKYGHNSRNTEKMAQVSEAEITGADSISQVYPEQLKKCREIGVEYVNKVFPKANISVDFSEIWKQEQENYKNSADDTEPNGADPEPQKAGEPE